MPRLMLTDERWEILYKAMLSTGRIYDKPTHRITMEGILYRMRTGLPWRDLPKEFGCWSKIFRRFNLWSSKGVLSHAFNMLVDSEDVEWLFIDGSIISAHQHGTGAASSATEDIGKS